MISVFSLQVPHVFSFSRMRKYAKRMFRGFFKTRHSVVFWFLATICFFGCLHENVRLIQNISSSLPQSYFLQVRHLYPRLGQYTLAWNERLSGNVIKQVIGKAGDQLWYDDTGTLWLNKRKIGKPYTKGTDGTPLTSIPAGIIPQGFVFLYAPHPRSFDSRYQEFGLVPQSALRGRLIPLSRGGEKRP